MEQFLFLLQSKNQKYPNIEIRSSRKDGNEIEFVTFREVKVAYYVFILRSALPMYVYARWLRGKGSVTMIKFVNHLLNIWLYE